MTKKDVWQSRVVAWRASGETAAAFSARHGLAANSLRWWASRLQHETPPGSLEEPTSSPIVRLAKVVRAPESGLAHGTIVLEMLDARVRVLVGAGVDREALATVLDVVGRGVTR